MAQATSGKAMVEALRLELTARRKQMGLTQLEVAQRLGVSDGHLSHMERGHLKYLGLDLLIRWATTLELDFSVVLRPRSWDAAVKSDATSRR